MHSDNDTTHLTLTVRLISSCVFSFTPIVVKRWVPKPFVIAGWGKSFSDRVPVVMKYACLLFKPVTHAVEQR